MWHPVVIQKSRKHEEFLIYSLCLQAETASNVSALTNAFFFQVLTSVLSNLSSWKL